MIDKSENATISFSIGIEVIELLADIAVQLFDC